MSKRTNKLLVVLLVLAMAFSVVAPALAAGETYTVKIKPSNSMTTPEADDLSLEEVAALKERFTAYQIFAGDLTTNDDREDAYNGTVTGTDPNTGYTNPNANWLSNVEWGWGVESVANLLKALKADGTKAADVGVTAEQLVAGGDRYAATYGNANRQALGDEASWVPEEHDNQSYEDAYAEALLADAKAALDGGLTLGTIYTKALEYAGYTDTDAMSNAQLKDTAKVVAKVLSDFTSNPGNNAALAEAFAKAIYNAEDVLVADTTPWLPKSEWVDTNGATAGYWQFEIPENQQGYYLVKDNYTENDPETGKSMSDFMVGVVGNTEIEAKSKAPEVDKKILTHEGNENNQGVASEIGKLVTFELEGGLPENYVNYEKYYYEFVDTMTDGLTFVDNSVSVSVKVKNPLKGTADGTANANAPWNTDEYITINIDQLKSAGTWTANDDGTHNDQDKFYVTQNGQQLNVAFQNLKGIKLNDVTNLRAQIAEAFGLTDDAANDQVTIDAIVAGLKIDRYSKVIVTYDAYLNDKALVDAPNKNDVKLRYTNDPSWDGNGESPNGETPKEFVYVYDFGIDLLKYDASTGTHKDPLAGAGFVMKKTVETYTVENVKVPEDVMKAYLGETFTWDNDYAGKTLAEIAEALGREYRNAEYDALSVATEPTKDNAPTTYYALFAKEGTEAAPYYALAGWMTEADVNGLLAPKTVATAVETDWTGMTTIANANAQAYLNKEYKGAATPANYYLALTTPANGHLDVRGMENGTYTLKEVFSPEGYDLLTEEINVTYTATYFDSDQTIDGVAFKKGMLKTLDISVKEGNNPAETKNVVIDGFWAEVDDAEAGTYKKTTTPAYEAAPAGAAQDDYEAHLSVGNAPKGWLPGTGGIGTTMFYIAGGVLLMVGAAFLFLNKKKAEAR